MRKHILNFIYIPKHVYRKAITCLIILVYTFSIVFVWTGNKVEAGDTSYMQINNYSFETLSGSSFANWSQFGGVWGTNVSQSTTRYLGDTHSLKVYDNSSSAGYGLRSDKYAANAYATYTATVAAYAESGGGQLYLEFWDASDNRISVQIASAGASGKWVLLRASGQAPAGTRYVSLLCYTTAGNIGTCYFDMAKLVRVDEVSGFDNPGFEGGTTGGVPNLWSVYSGTMGTNLFMDTSIVHGGSNSFKIVDSSTSAGYGLRSAPVPAAAGLKYEASSWIYNASGNGQIYLEFWSSTVNNASDTRIGTVVISSSTTGQWQKISGTGVAPSGTEYMTILLYITQTSTGTSYYDDLVARQYYDPASTLFTPQVTTHPRMYFTFYGVDPNYVLVVDYVTLGAAGTPEILLHGDGGSIFTNTSGTPLTIGSALPSNFIIEKTKGSVAVQSLRPSSATRLYTQYTGAEWYGSYGSIKTAAITTAESFVTLLRPNVDKTGITEGENLLTAYTSGGGIPYESFNKFGYNCASYDGTGAGDYISYTFNVSSANTYNINIGLEKSLYGGIFTVKLDGVTLQSGVDTYGQTDNYTLSFTNKVLSAGNHTIQFDITGKNASSFGYKVGFDNVRVFIGSIIKAQPYTVTTATNGLTTGLSIAVDASTTDQQLLNPSKGTGYTAGSLSITSKATQGMFRKASSGSYLRYGQVDTLTTGATLLDGTQVIVQDLGVSGSIGMFYDTSISKWVGTIRLAATAAPKMYMPSVTSVKLDGTTLSAGQYSYSSTTKLLTISSVSSGDHTIEVTQ